MTNKQWNERLDEIVVDSLREAYAYAYNKGQQHDTVPDHLQAEAIKRKLEASINNLVAELIGEDEYYQQDDPRLMLTGEPFEWAERNELRSELLKVIGKSSKEEK